MTTKTTTVMLLAVMAVSLATVGTAYAANVEAIDAREQTIQAFEPQGSVWVSGQNNPTIDAREQTIQAFEPQGSVWVSGQNNQALTNDSGPDPQSNHTLLDMIRELRAAIDRLEARVAALESGSGTPPPTPGVPDRITDLRASIVSDANGNVQLNWTVPASNGAPITGYVIRESTTSANGPWTTATTSLSPPIVTTRDPNTTYYFQVAAENRIGQALWSNTASVTTSGGSPPPTPGVPDKITDLRAHIDSDGDIELNWTTPNNNGNPLTSTDVRFSTTSSNGPWLYSNPGTYRAFSPIWIIGPTPNTTYYIQVAAVNNIGAAPWSNTASVSTSGSGSQTTGIQGKVFTDYNNNNRLDPGEPGRAGIEVITVSLANHSDVQRLRTDANGDFTFNRAAGGYLLQAIGGGPNSYAYLTVPNNTMLTQNLAY